MENKVIIQGEVMEVTMKQLIFDEVVNDAHRQELSEAKICQLSSSMIEITAKESKKSLIMPISNIDTERLADISPQLREIWRLLLHSICFQRRSKANPTHLS